MKKNTKCDWCEQGICTYWGDVDEQYEKEQEGIPVAYCDGTVEEMNECGVDIDVDERCDPKD